MSLQELYCPAIVIWVGDKICIALKSPKNPAIPDEIYDMVLNPDLPQTSDLAKGIHRQNDLPFHKRH
jgi:hypothetical protein